MLKKSNYHRVKWGLRDFLSEIAKQNKTILE